MKRFFTAFILLSLVTILLLVFSVQFYSAVSVRAQISDWVNQMAQRIIPGNEDQVVQPRQPAPLSTQAAALRSMPGLDPGPTVTPTADRLEEEPVQDLAYAQRKEEAAPAPVYRVIEEPPPDGSLVIPVLGIDQPVIPIGFNDQEWDLTDLGEQIGWLQTTGSHPRDDLSMAFVGHITLPYPGGSGPFLYLNTLKPGDVIGYRSGAETYIYEVKGKSVVKPNQVDSIYRPDGKTILLITCTGYNAIDRRYDLRLIVEAELVSVEK